MPSVKDARLNLRLEHGDNELIRSAASSLGVSVSEFLTDAAVVRAHDVLASQRHFTVDEETWDAFITLLDDQPAAPDQRLTELLAAPRAFRR